MQRRIADEAVVDRRDTRPPHQYENAGVVELVAEARHVLAMVPEQMKAKLDK